MTRPYPHWLMTKECRKKNNLSIRKNYKTGKRKPAFKGEKRPEHSKILLEQYKNGRKPPMIFGKDNAAWKGDKVSYSGLHYWVHRKLGKPKGCSNPVCKYPRKNSSGKLLKFPKRFEWANVDHKYRRNEKEYISLCTSCHRNYDLLLNN